MIEDTPEKRVWVWQVPRYVRAGWKSCWDWRVGCWSVDNIKPWTTELIRPWIVSPQSKYFDNW